jgi:hypothetical protein
MIIVRPRTPADNDALAHLFEEMQAYYNVPCPPVETILRDLCLAAAGVTIREQHIRPRASKISGNDRGTQIGPDQMRGRNPPIPIHQRLKSWMRARGSSAPRSHGSTPATRTSTRAPSSSSRAIS